MSNSEKKIQPNLGHYFNWPVKKNNELKLKDSNIILNKTYNFTIDNISFGDLSYKQLIQIFSDGRIISHLLERQLEIWFPDLTFVDKHGYDHIDKNNTKYDQKSFTKSGCKFMPSYMQGGSRKFNDNEAHEHCKKIIYIICDVTKFPNIKVRFIQGSELIKKYPKCIIPYKQLETVFNSIY